jgi:hypothetical protein
VKARAAALHTTPSELVRRLLEREVGAFEGEPSALELTSRWVGIVAGQARASRRARPRRSRELGARPQAMKRALLDTGFVVALVNAR